MKSYVFYLIFTLEFFLLLVLLYRRWRYRSFLTLKSKPLTLREISSQQVIPKVLHQTYKDVARIPRKVYENIREFAPEYEHLVYSDSDVVSFLSTNFKPEVLQAFHTLKLGAHKADLFRYCILYVKGGVYLDIKTELIKPLDKLFKDGAINTVISRVSSEIYQGVIASPPGQGIFLSLIYAIVKRCMDPPYNLFIIDFMKYITWDTASKPKDGINVGKQFTYYLLRETCSGKADECEDGLDRYHKCCNIFSTFGREIKTRYADYPW